MEPLLDIRDLQIEYQSSIGELCRALDGVSLSLRPREILGVLGESGSGKSTLAASLLRLLPPNGFIRQGQILFEGKDLLLADRAELERIRGGRISLIFQEPGVALHPTLRIGRQIEEVLRAHDSPDAASRRERSQDALSSVFSSDAERIYSSYPHQLSGGQRQRAVIAQAIACHPSLLVADEPTASLDPATQSEILLLFRQFKEQLGLSLILITHNPGLLAGFADRVAVLYAGEIVELGPADAVLQQPQHPYTRALLQCMPVLDANNGTELDSRLPVIAGDPPDLSAPAGGCRFAPRCPERMEICTMREPVAVQLNDTHQVSCFKYGG